MPLPRRRHAPSVALSGIALALGLFASAGPAIADTSSARAAEANCDMASAECDTNRDARQMGFGRRGGDK